MPTRLNRALQVRTADRLRASLARDEISGLPAAGTLSDTDQLELLEVGGGRIAAVAIYVEWQIDSVRYARAIHDMHAAVMNAVARIVDERVRRTDLLGSLSDDALVIFAPALDPIGGRSLAQRLRLLFADRLLEIDDVQVQLHVKVGFASRSAASPVGWTTQTLAGEARRNALDVPPIAIGA
jgi:GGDEF domain-containing protein